MIRVMLLDMVSNIMSFRIDVSIKYLVLGFLYILLFEIEEFCNWLKFKFVMVVKFIIEEK